jgi:hypothetical protein
MRELELSLTLVGNAALHKIFFRQASTPKR